MAANANEERALLPMLRDIKDAVSRLDGKIDALSTASTEQRVMLAHDDKRINDHDGRLSKLERWMWLSLGAGGAAGAGLAKLVLG